MPVSAATPRGLGHGLPYYLPLTCIALVAGLLAGRQPAPALIVAGLVGVCLLAVATTPVVALLVFAILWNLVNIELVKILEVAPGWSYYLSDVAVLGAIGLALLQTVGSKARGFGGRYLLLITLLITCGIWAEIREGGDLLTALLGLRWLVYPALAAAVARLSPRERAMHCEATVNVLCVGVLATQLPVAAYQVATRQPLPAPEFNGVADGALGVAVRAYGLVGWPTTLALLSLVPTLALLVRLLHGHASRRERLMLLCLVGLLIFTFSRGAALALLVAGLVGSLLGHAGVGSRRRVLLVATGAAVAVLAAIAVGGQGLASRASDLNPVNYSQSVAQGGRLALVRVGLQLMQEHPLIGQGPGTFGSGAARAAGNDVEDVTHERILTSESSLLQVGVEEGLFGLAAAALLFAIPLRLLVRRVSAEGDGQIWRVIAAAGLVALGVATLTAPALEIRQIALPVWLLVGAAASSEDGV